MRLEQKLLCNYDYILKCYALFVHFACCFEPFTNLILDQLFDVGYRTLNAHWNSNLLKRTLGDEKIHFEGNVFHCPHFVALEDYVQYDLNISRVRETEFFISKYAYITYVMFVPDACCLELDTILILHYLYVPHTLNKQLSKLQRAAANVGQG